MRWQRRPPRNNDEIPIWREWINAALTGFAYVPNFKTGDGTNYTEFDTVGFLTFNGEARPWVDMQWDIASGRVAAANFPDWEAFTTNTAAYGFAVDDYIDLKAEEVPHGWKEGSNISVHLHIALKDANATGSNRYAKFTIYPAYADVGDVWAEATALTAELTIPTGSAALTDFILSVGTLSLPNNTVGTRIKPRIKRIAATGGTEYSGNIFITQVGGHLELDTIGSREVASK